MPGTSRLIYLGRSTTMADTDTSNGTTENQSVFTNVNATVGAPLNGDSYKMQFIVATHDGTDPGPKSGDYSGLYATDNVTYSIEDNDGNTVNVSTQGSAEAYFQLSVSFSDGSSQTLYAYGGQFENGDIVVDDHFYTNPPPAPLTPANLGGKTITGINVLGIVVDEVGYMAWAQPTPENFEIACFVTGTRIRTPSGEVPVEDLAENDLVVTRSGEHKPIMWIGRRPVSQADLNQRSKLRPICITSGSLGIGVPSQDLYVSRQHRMLVSSKIAERVTGHSEVLVSAIKLTELPGVFEVTDTTDLAYFHILLDQHEILFANNAPAESLYLGPMTLQTMTKPALAEILALFPEVKEVKRKVTPARPILEGRIQRALISRHRKNGKPVWGSLPA